MASIRREIGNRLTEREAASVGPRDLKKPGTVDWAWQTINALKRHWTMKELSVRQFDDIVEELKRYKAWEIVPPGNPYGSLDAMLAKEIGHTEAEAVAKVAARAKRIGSHGGDRRTKPLAEHGGRREEQTDQGSHTTLKGDRGADYLAARIARDRPDILERMKAGEFRSVRRAAIEAGIVKVPTKLQILQKTWLKATKQEREAFIEWADKDGEWHK